MTVLDKHQHCVAYAKPGVKAMTGAERGHLKSELKAMWKYELVGLYAHTIHQQCDERDDGKRKQLMERAEMMSEEILARMTR